MKIERHMTADKLRETCIKYDLCTCMTDTEYYNMLEECEDVTDKLIPKIAEYIAALSNTDRTTHYIAWLLATEAMTVYVTDEE